MQAFRIQSKCKLTPFDEEPRALYIADRTLAQWQEDACRACGLTLTDIDSPEGLGTSACIVFYDNVFFTEMSLRNFVADAMNNSTDIALQMPTSTITRALAPASSARPGEDNSCVYDIFGLGSGRVFASKDELREHCLPKLQVHRSKKVNVALPRLEGGPTEAEAEISARIVAHVNHWIHLLRLSQFSVGVILLDHFRKEPSRLFGLKWRRRFGLGRRHLRNFVHSSAKVHPTAYLDSVVVGPGCTIGPHAHVHHSILGENVSIGDHAAVMGSTLAAGVQVLRASYIAHCASMPGSSLSSHKVQLSIFGKDVFLTSSAKLLDAKFRGEIAIEHEGRLIPVGSAFLGACLGHGVVLGADTTIQSGRAIPNKLTIVASPEKVVSVVESFEEGSLLRVEDGKLRPIDPTQSGLTDQD